jgi:hypothetical protein
MRTFGCSRTKFTNIPRAGDQPLSRPRLVESRDRRRTVSLAAHRPRSPQGDLRQSRREHPRRIRGQAVRRALRAGASQSRRARRTRLSLVDQQCSVASFTRSDWPRTAHTPDRDDGPGRRESWVPALHADARSRNARLSANATAQRHVRALQPSPGWGLFRRRLPGLLAQATGLAATAAMIDAA